MTTIVKRLEALRQHYNMSVRGLADRLNQRPATVINYCNGTQPPKLEFITLLLDTFPEISAEWLLRGKGTMLIKDLPEVTEIQRQYHTDLLVKDGIIKELRAIILEKNADTQAPERKQLVG